MWLARADRSAATSDRYASVSKLAAVDGGRQPWLAAQALERDGLGEFGAELVARRPFDHRIGAIAPRQHQPDAGSNLEAAVGFGHEAAFRNVDNAGVDAAL